MLTGVLMLVAVATCGLARAELTRAELRDALVGASIDLFKATTADELGNSVLCPPSVNILLALLDQGARGRSSQQLQTALRLEHDQLKEGYSRLSADLQRSGSDDVQLEVANRVFISVGFPLNKGFLQTATRDFYSGVENVTFGSPSASNAINAWVDRATHGKITNIVEPVLPPSTVMVLTNAVYFKSPWMKPFNKPYTQEKIFYVNPTKNVSVPFMHQEEAFLMGSDENLGVQWVELLFKNTNYSLLVVLPKEKFGLSNVLTKLTSPELTKMLQRSTSQGVNLYLPRFRLGSNTKLIPALKKLGITDIFEEGRADLSGISSEPLSVSEVRQKATMEIDEDGGVAAAATVVEIVPLSSSVFLDPEEIVANHPFFAAIVDKNSGVPLFMGTVIDPSVN